MAFQAHIERCSLAAATLLRRHRPLVGRLHSCYARILNIQVPSGQLLTLQGHGLLQAPCAASLAEDIENWPAVLAPGDLVMQGDDPSAILTLNTLSMAIWDGRLRPLAAVTATKLGDAGAQLAGWLRQHASQQGIVPALTALDAPHPPALSPLHRRICDALAPMYWHGCLSADSIAQMAAQLIGLGEGLTPSGDDLLVGFLAVLHIAGLNTFVLSLPALIDPYLTNTPDLSRTFLQYALKGHFSEPLAQFVHALYHAESPDWANHATHLARVGHSSGVDAMVGIVIASRLLTAGGAPPKTEVQARTKS